jgi:CRP-like cAMP-binding protein
MAIVGEGSWKHLITGPFGISRVASGREQTLAIEGPGSSFTELPVFDGGNYPASAAASEDTEVLFISRKEFQDFCREHPDVGLKVVAVVGSTSAPAGGNHQGSSWTKARTGIS